MDEILNSKINAKYRYIWCERIRMIRKKLHIHNYIYSCVRMAYS